MNGVTVIATEPVKTLRELRESLQRFAIAGGNEDEIYVNDGNAVVTLEEQTLTDKSKVYNLSIEAKAVSRG